MTTQSTATQNAQATNSKRKRAQRTPETLEAAVARIEREFPPKTDKERQQFAHAKEALLSGAATRENPAVKLSKAGILRIGAEVAQANEEQARESRIAETLRTKPANYHVITNDRDLAAMMARLDEELRLQKKDEWFQRVFEWFNNTHIRRKLLERGIEIPLVQSLTEWDTETSGLDLYLDMTGGYSFWLPLLNEGYYVAYGHLTGDAQCSRTAALDAIRVFIADAAHIKAFHNAPFDLNMFLNDGLEAHGFRYCSADGFYTLSGEEYARLKDKVAQYKPLLDLPRDMDDFTFEDLFGNQSPMSFPPEVVGIYAIKDVHKGWAFTKWQINLLMTRDNLGKAYFEIRQYLIEVNVNIVRTGFDIDLEHLAALGEEYRPKLGAARQAIFDSYQIDDAFLYDMSMAIKGDKIREWCEKRARRNATALERYTNWRMDIGKKTPGTKVHAELQRKIAQHETTVEIEPTPQNAPDFIHEFNLNSDDHLAYLIYDRLGIKDRTGEIDKDKTKRRGTSKDVLKVYFEEEPSLKPLATYSMFSTLLGTFIDKIPNALDVDGRLHTELGVTQTNRYTSKGYKGKPLKERPQGEYLDVMRALVEMNDKVDKGSNIQNIPSRSDEGRRVRMTFMPREGYTFVGSDLKAIEPRLQALRILTEFGDSSFVDMFVREEDPYVEFGAMTFDVDKELCLESTYKARKGTPDAIPDYRKAEKELMLAQGYGQAFDQFRKKVATMGVSEEQARAAYAKFPEILPTFKQMVDATIAKLRETGFAETMWGQKRRFPEYKQQWARLSVLMRKVGIVDADGNPDKSHPELSKKIYARRGGKPILSRTEIDDFWQLIKATGRAERQAFNHTIQGAGAQVLQFIMIRFYYECVLERGWLFYLTLHDELKHGVPNDQLTPEAIELYNDIMRNTITLAVPLDCDTVIEPRWMEEYAPDEWDFVNCRPFPEAAAKYDKYRIQSRSATEGSGHRAA